MAQVRPLGALLSGVAMTALAWTLIGLPVKGLADPGTLTGMGVAVASLVAFVAWEAGTPSLMLPLGLIAASTVAATLGQRLGNRPLAAAGLTVVAAGFGLLATLSPGDGFVVVATAPALFGAGAGLAQPATIAALMGAVPSEHAGVWSALNDTIQQAGSVLGVAALGSVLASSFTGAMPASAAEAARHSKYGSCPVPRCRRSQWQDSAS